MIPREYRGQLIHQAVVLDVEYVLFVVARNTGLIYQVRPMWVSRSTQCFFLRMFKTLLIPSVYLRSCFQQHTGPRASQQGATNDVFGGIVAFFSPCGVVFQRGSGASLAS